MAVMLPYANYTPDSSECGDFWEHQVLRHLPGGEAISQHTLEELNAFLDAVASGDPKATLVKIAIRSGGGIAALFRFAGKQWLFFTGPGLLPSTFRPVDQNAVRAALTGQTYKTPPKGANASLQNSARCFRETAPVTVEVTVEATVQIPVSTPTSQFTLGTIPAVGSTATQPILTPVPVGSYQLPIFAQGTPVATDIQNYTYSFEYGAYLWTPEGNFGLTPKQMADAIIVGGGVIVVVGVVALTAEIWVPLIVIGAPSAAALAPAFAP